MLVLPALSETSQRTQVLHEESGSAAAPLPASLLGVDFFPKITVVMSESQQFTELLFSSFCLSLNLLLR